MSSSHFVSYQIPIRTIQGNRGNKVSPQREDLQYQQQQQPSTSFIQQPTEGHSVRFDVQGLSPKFSSNREIPSTPFLASPSFINYNKSIPNNNNSRTFERNPRHISHPTKSILRSTTFVKERSSNFTPVPVYVPRLVSSNTNIHRLLDNPSNSNSSRTFNSNNNINTAVTCPSTISSFNSQNKSKFETETGNSRTKNSPNFSFNFNGNNHRSQSTTFTERSNKEPLSRVLNTGQNQDHLKVIDPRQTSVILPSNRIPVTVEIHHPSHYIASVERSPQIRNNQTQIVEESQLQTTEDVQPKKKKVKTEDMTVYSLQSNNQTIPINPYPIMDTTRLNGIIPNGSATMIKSLPPGQRSIDLETISEEGQFSNCGVGARSLFNFGGKMSRQRRASHVEFGNFPPNESLATISGDIDPAIELKVPHLDRRRSSVIAFERFFKSRTGDRSRHTSVASSRPSIVSRLSFSSDRHDPNELIVTNFNRMTDLRKMLNQQEEKEDFLTNFWSRFYSCECFEWNLNNAAKCITLIILILTLIMLIRAVVGLIS